MFLSQMRKAFAVANFSFFVLRQVPNFRSIIKFCKISELVYERGTILNAETFVDVNYSLGFGSVYVNYLILQLFKIMSSYIFQHVRDVNANSRLDCI